MANIRISDMTMKQAAEGFSLSFKEKIELAKLLDKLGVSVIELEGMENPRVDSLQIKSIATAVKTSVVAVPVSLHKESVQEVWNALQVAKNPRLQVVASVSAVQMEYLYHKKPDGMIAAIAQTVADCVAVCSDVEFVAEDATRSDFAFLCKAVETAISAGATTVTLCEYSDHGDASVDKEVLSSFKSYKSKLGSNQEIIWDADDITIYDKDGNRVDN